MNTNLTYHNQVVTKEQRQQLLRQKSPVIWLTGLSGSGKSTIANQLAADLHQLGHLTYILDGDNIRMGLNKDLGFSDDDRKENIRRIAEVAKLTSDAGVIVITAFISPFRAEREIAKSIIGEENFIEVFVDTPLRLCEERDPKGLYKKARAGQIKQFTGIDSPYESPLNASIVINTDGKTPQESASEIKSLLSNSKSIYLTEEEMDSLDKSKTLAIDFDGVLHKYTSGFKGLYNAYDEPMPDTKWALDELKLQGWKLKICTSRPKEVVIEWLSKWNLSEYFDEVSNVKFPATLYIDDRAFHFQSWKQIIDEIPSHPKNKK